MTTIDTASTVTTVSANPAPARTATATTVLLCAPEHYDVTYAINPWMDPSVPTDTALALEQWRALRDTYRSIGFVVHEIEPGPGLPDMVYAANGATVIDDVAYSASFRYPERQPEADAYAAWLSNHGLRVVPSTHINEGEGDFLVVGDVVLAGTGFRASVESHHEGSRVLNREFVTLTLVRPEYYHLDTAIAVLDARPGQERIAYLPSAFDTASLAVLRERYPDAIIVSEQDAAVLGLNVVSDGLHVVMPVQAGDFAEQLRASGFEPVQVNLSELLKAGGGVKCCTMALRFSQPTILSPTAVPIATTPE
ncbi:dimethylargininase [Demequina oxidasica]|uniref:dimethylargininase n=1 Tax=Demequina oxidasica TaxID=676199 RepID=UPI0007814C6B|nr:dimethylargininase [Demequina oxidasica]